MPFSPPDWQLPTGVNRGLWDYLHDEAIATGYDASLAESTLFKLDERFVEEVCPARSDQPTRLLDLGCGTGRLLLRLARKGWWVLGVDLSWPMLDVARRRAVQAGVQIQLLQANLAELDALADDSFDHAACLFSTLGMVVGPSARWQVLTHAHRVLRPGGRLVLHVHNRWFHLWDSPGRRWLLGDLGRWVCCSTDVGDHVMPAHQGIAGLTLHLFSRGEALTLLRQVGFRIVETRPVSLDPGGQVGWGATWRAYGFLLVAEKS